MILEDAISQLGLELRLDASGACRLVFDGRTPVEIERPADRDGAAFLHSTVGLMPPAGRREPIDEARRRETSSAADAARADLATEPREAVRARSDARTDASGELSLSTGRPDVDVTRDASGTAQPTAASDAAVNAPFSQARIDGIIDTMLDAYAPDDHASNSTNPVPAGGDQGFQVAAIFKRDMIRSRTIAFDGALLRGTVAGEAELGGRLHHSCTALQDQGLSRSDILLVSRIMNQGTNGTLAERAMLAPELVPGISRGNGEVVPITVDADPAGWAISKTDNGLEVTYGSLSKLENRSMMTDRGTRLAFGKGSTLAISPTFVLTRDESRQPSPTGMRASRFTMSAVDLDGRRLV